MPSFQQVLAWLGLGPAGAAATPGGGAGIAGSGISLQTILQLITALGGANMGTYQINMLKQLFARQQQAAAMAQNASGISSRGAMATLPINRELAYITNNAADAGSANAGLAEAPGAVAGARAAALAPIAQQNVVQGQENARFGLPTGGFGAPAVPDFLSILKDLNQFGAATGGGTYALPAGVI